MATIRPFRALRYNTRDPLSVALVTAPPYDCISPQEQDDLYRLHPHNIVRLILGKEFPGDDDRNNRYTRAADLLKKWQAAAILARDADPAIYFYQQEFLLEGRSYLREGFLARLGLEPFGSGRVFPHEETMPGPKADRLKLMRATGANLSPIFGLFPDPKNAVTALFHEHKAKLSKCDPIAQTVDGDGVVHRLFACTDSAFFRRIAEAMADRSIFIADGHHRYETALAYRDELKAAGESVGPDHPASSVLALFVSMHHPGLVILPTHRILSGLKDLAVDRLLAAAQDHFTWQEFKGAEATSPRLADHLAQARGHAFGLWVRGTQSAFLLTLKDPKIMDRLAADHSKAWRSLDVAVLERVLLKEVLPQAADVAPLRLSYAHLAQEAFDAVHEDSADAAFILRPLPIESLQAVVAEGERMPTKSTYFYPKAISGLVINPLD
ncbi:MAG TPA: DUF1015 domain-containing protein [Phycisphaerae bacterium]|nr:DUF1015 domain-containing protein [Phycisphaerae bacterium]